MIQESITHQCARCGSARLVRNGHDYKEAQVGYPTTVQLQVQRAVIECMSLWGIERVFGISCQTVARWITQWGQALEPLATTLVPAQSARSWNWMRVWSFVGKKAEDGWLWVALCRRTRQIVAYYWGKRTYASCVQLWQRLPNDYAWQASVSDFLHESGPLLVNGCHYEN